MNSQRIEICGGIGAGKSSAALALSNVGYELRRELPETTPFWSDYYVEKKTHLQFEKNLSFVIHHLYLTCQDSDSNNTVCDFSFFEDLAYIMLMSDGRDRQFLIDLVVQILSKHGPPRKLLFIKSPPLVRMERILKRGRPGEIDITIGFLAAFDRELEGITREFCKSIDVSYVDNSLRPYQDFLQDVPNAV